MPPIALAPPSGRYLSFAEREEIALLRAKDPVSQRPLEPGLASRIGVVNQPDTTLDDIFDRVAEQAIGSTALIDMITSNRHDPRAEHLGTRVIAVADAMLARDQAQRRVGAHVTTDDVMLSVSMLAFVLSRTDPDDRPAVAVRAHALFRAAFDG